MKARGVTHTPSKNIIIGFLSDLKELTIDIERENGVVEQMMSTMTGVMQNTDAAVRSYMMLRPIFLHRNSANASKISPANATDQPIPSLASVYDVYSSFPIRPSSFMQSTSAWFEKRLLEYHKRIEEIEHLLFKDTDKDYRFRPSLKSIGRILSNIHDFFIHVAAKVENLHQYVESRKKVYLADQRRRGDKRH